jgi:hypothetical protein
MYLMMMLQITFQMMSKRLRTSSLNILVGMIPAQAMSSGETIRTVYFSPSSCGATMYICNNQGGYGSACPYNICRESVLLYSSAILVYICIILVALLVLHILAVICGYPYSKESKDIDIENESESESSRIKDNNSSTGMSDLEMIHRHSRGFMFPIDSDAKGSVNAMTIVRNNRGMYQYTMGGFVDRQEKVIAPV